MNLLMAWSFALMTLTFYLFLDSTPLYAMVVGFNFGVAACITMETIIDRQST